MEFLSLTRRCPSWRNVPNGEERRDTAVFSSEGVLVKSLVFKKASKISTIACSRRSDSGERCEVKRSAKKIKAREGER